VTGGHGGSVLTMSGTRSSWRRTTSPFHTISFPGSILGTREPCKLVDFIKGFNSLNYYGGKFSTSRGVGVFMEDALQLLPADYWRWYLLANAPESDDSSFTWELFAGAVNKDLADNLGNFVNRTLTFTSRRFGDAIPAGRHSGTLEQELASDLDRVVTAYAAHLEDIQFRKSTSALREVWALGNRSLERAEPWITVRNDPDQAAFTLRTAIDLIRIFAVLAAPMIPTASERILNALGLPPATGSIREPTDAEITVLQPGHAFTVPDVLFPEISRLAFF
jgi:methionyl-tRNA synthetase